MHLSDNNGDSDTHLGVGCGTINWTATTELIKSINYDGLLMVESIERIEESIKALGQLFS